MLKTGVVIFHKNIYSIFKERWILECVASIRNQTHQDFRVFELCYGDTPERIYEGSEYIHQPMENHIFAMNYILDVAFAHGCDVVMVTNADDFYNHHRFQVQLDAISRGYDLVSCDFAHIEEQGNTDVIIRDMKFSDRDIHTELRNDHNVICHSATAITKNFWETHKYYNTDSLGFEDKQLWQKASEAGCKMFITAEILCYYRIHEKQTGTIHAVVK